MVDISQFKNFVSYDPETGEFKWISNISRKSKVGELAGSYSSKYHRIQAKGTMVYGHRLAFYLMTGKVPEFIDHIDGNGHNNRWENLRSCSVVENMCNRGKPVSNTVGKKGVSFSKHANKYRAYITLKGKQQHLGYYDTVDEAAKSYKEAAPRIHGQFHNTGEIYE